MVQVYYRTNAAIEKKPVCFAPSDEGLLKDDYELVYEVPTEMAPFPLEEVFRMMNVVDGDEVPVKLGVRLAR